MPTNWDQDFLQVYAQLDEGSQPQKAADRLYTVIRRLEGQLFELQHEWVRAIAPEPGHGSRSHAELVADCNELAREFYKLEGHKVPKGFEFHASKHPHEQRLWAQAAHAFEVLQATPMSDVLLEHLEGSDG